MWDTSSAAVVTVLRFIVRLVAALAVHAHSKAHYISCIVLSSLPFLTIIWSIIRSMQLDIVLRGRSYSRKVGVRGVGKV